MLTLEPEWIWCASVGARSSVVEHVTFNHGVAGSTPAGPTNKFNNLWEFDGRGKRPCHHYVTTGQSTNLGVSDAKVS